MAETEINNFTSLFAAYTDSSMDLVNVWQHLTAWSFALILLHKWTYRYINLLFLSGTVLVLALYISYIKPGYIKYHDLQGSYKITGHVKVTIDLLFHCLPFVFVWFKYGKYYGGHRVKWSIATSNASVLLLIYLIMFNPKEIYDANNDVLWILAIALTTYLITN